jgi:hypothetical protein
MLRMSEAHSSGPAGDERRPALSPCGLQSESECVLMTKFTNGPAAGTVLSLRRSPLFLRAVQDAEGKWDALSAKRGLVS